MRPNPMQSYEAAGNALAYICIILAVLTLFAGVAWLTH